MRKKVMFQNRWFSGQLFLFSMQLFLLISVSSRGAEYRAAVFDEPGFPVVGKNTPPQTIQETFADEGVKTDLLNADQLSDPNRMNISNYDLLVIPTGASFPLSAKSALLAFLQQGGDLFCTGGYAFDSLWVREEGAWISYQTYWKDQLAKAQDPQVHLVSNGGWEEGRNGWNTSNSQNCTVVETSSFRGKFCAQVVNAATNSGARWEKELPLKSGESYLIGAHMRSESIQGTGYGYLAVYQYDAQGNLVNFIDFSQVTKTQEWKRVETLLTIDYRAAKVMFYGGLYLATGTFWFDDVTCAPLAREERINAHYGKPQDGLVVEPSQLTLFSPDQMVSGVRLQSLSTDPEMNDWSYPTGSPGEVIQGYEATAQLRYNARWIPWLKVLDERGNDAGVAGAIVEHVAGPFHRSRWALFGVTTQDLFAGAEGRTLLRNTLRRLRSGIVTQSLNADYPMYSRGETVSAQWTVQNISQEPMAVSSTIQFSYPDLDQKPRINQPILYSLIQTATLPARSEHTFQCRWEIPKNASDFIAVKTITQEGDAPGDERETGFCVADETTMQHGTAIRYRDNAFELTPWQGSSRHVSLWGTDTYGNMFHSPSQSPLTWFGDLQRMRDYGLHLFENLQFTPRQYRYSDRQWRDMDAIIQLSQRFGLPYMAGLLIGQNVVVEDEELAEQAEMCRQFAARYAQVPGLIYYLNGDFQLNLKDTDDIRRMWNDFLRKQYETEAALQKAWSPAPIGASLGNIPVRDYAAQSWYDVKARDLNRFRTFLMNRWIGALCRAIRQEDRDHPITSEYYQRPYSGIDLRLTMGDMDAANFGYFDRPKEDIAKMMAIVKWNDMRFYGKTINMGEFGVKTHDAWEVERGGTHYHIRRTPEEQLQLFWWVAHTAFSMGVTKIQNWCWNDDSDSIFPWGVVWSHPSRPKPAAKLYRNLRFLSEQMPTVYVPAEVLFMMPENWRLGAPENLSHTSLLNALECLLATGTPFDMADESQLDKVITKKPKLLIAPFAYAYSEETIRQLQDLAKQGCCVYLSGDPSVDLLGQRMEQRLVDLCGVRFTGIAEHASGLPIPQVTPLQAESVENPAGLPLFRMKQGDGQVFYVPEPWEAFPGEDLFVTQSEITSNVQKNLYLSLLPLASLPSPVSIQSSTGVWRGMKTPTGEQQWISVFPRSFLSESATVEMKTDATQYRYEFERPVPSGILVNAQNQPVAITGNGSLFVDNQPIVSGKNSWILIGMDHRSLRDSQVVMLSAVEGGTVWWSNSTSDMVAYWVEWNDGQMFHCPNDSLHRVEGGWEMETSANGLYLIASRSQIQEQLQWLDNAFTGTNDYNPVPNWSNNE